MPIGKFDPTRCGQFELNWWRAHNDHDTDRLFRNLIDQHIELYALRKNEAREALGYLVKAVKFHDTRDWDSAIQTVTKYYEVIKNKSGLTFDPTETARLEVGWWRLHDELEHNPDKSPLADAFTFLYSALLNLSKEKLTRAGQLKAEATREHDLAEDPTTPKTEVEAHWAKASDLLVSFYQELQRVAKNPD